jgi:hypothetical protein
MVLEVTPRVFHSLITEEIWLFDKTVEPGGQNNEKTKTEQTLKRLMAQLARTANFSMKENAGP